MAEHESSLAVLVDFENMARPGIKGRGDFDIHLVLDRLSDKGRVLVKRAYADWSRYRDARHELQNAGLELIEMPSAREGAKNRADIKMAVDAMELAFSREHLDTFVIVSGDSDFTPLVGKLRELNKRVTGLGNRDSTSELLIANCDEFIYLRQPRRRGAELGARHERRSGRDAAPDAHRAATRGHRMAACERRQGLDAPQEPGLRRVRHRLLDLLEIPRGPGRPGHDPSGVGPAVRHLPGGVVELRSIHVCPGPGRDRRQLGLRGDADPPPPTSPSRRIGRARLAVVRVRRVRGADRISRRVRVRRQRHHGRRPGRVAAARSADLLRGHDPARTRAR